MILYDSYKTYSYMRLVITGNQTDSEILLDSG